MTAHDPIPPDIRSIDTMPFGSGAPDPLSVAMAVRETLRRCGVTVAHEIEELGCTGASAKGLTVTEIADLRMGLGGGGVGLPCFVPPTRYCLAHSTIGGLQIGQLGRFPDEISKISRDLAPRERGQMELIEASRRVRGGDLHERLLKTADALGGRDLPMGVELVEDDEDDDEEEEDNAQEIPAEVTAATVARMRGASFDWVCSEHSTPKWSCRYCVAQMIVEGPLEPEFVMRESGQLPVAVDTANVETQLGVWTHKGVARVDVYARVATYSRKLARD